MNSLALFSFVLFSSLTGLSAFHDVSGQTPEVPVTSLMTVKNLNLQSFTGHWFEVYQPSADSSNFCNVIDMNIPITSEQFPDVIWFGMDLSCRTDSVTGKLSTIHDQVYSDHFLSLPGMFRVVLPNGDVISAYVLALGGADGASIDLPTGPAVPIAPVQYTWAIIANTRSSFPLIIARDATTFDAKYKAIVDQKLTALGFDTTDLLSKRVTHEGCVYSNLPAAAGGQPPVSPAV